MNKSRFNYTESQKEINRAFKMQEKELTDAKRRSTALENSISQAEKSMSEVNDETKALSDQTDDLLKRAIELAKVRGIKVDIPQVSPHLESTEQDDEPYLADIPLQLKDIPTWEDVMRKTDDMVPDEVVLEELLSAEEIQYCTEDVERINNEFAQKTHLNKVDIAFLVIASALQTARWIIIQKVIGDLGENVDKDNRINSKEGDRQKKKDVHNWNEKHDNHPNKSGENGYPTWKDILFGQYARIDGNGKSIGVCPYDAQENAPMGFDEGGRGNHRLYTLGHDPILGWIFGTANLMTCTISLSKKFNFATYNVEYPGGRFSEMPTSMIKMFYDVFESTKEDKFRLAAALFAQYAHLKSDVFTERGLPVPLIEAFSEELAGKLYSEQYDALCLARDTAIVGSQAAFSILINMIIGFIHGLFYNKDKDGLREHYEVRTRKILLYSNALSTSINLAYVGVNASYGNVGEALKKLDLGGLLVTLYRLFSDIRFITKVKERFIKEELDKVTKDALADLDSMFEKEK